MSSRYEITEIEGGIQCKIRCWKSWRYIIQWPIAYMFMLCAVYFGFGGNRNLNSSDGYCFFTLLALTACTGTAFWLRNLFGREIVTINDNKLIIRNEIMPDIGWNKYYIVSEIRNFSLHKPFGPPNMWRVEFSKLSAPEDMDKFMSRGTIKFEHIGLTRYFAPKLHEEDAREIYEHMIKYLPATAFTRTTDQSTVPKQPTDGLFNERLYEFQRQNSYHYWWP